MLEFDYARNALRYLIRQYSIRELHIPYYLCDVVRHALVEEGCKPQFYHIDDSFFPKKNFSKDDFVLYPNYFGICDKNVKRLVKIYPKLIVDNAHSLYAQPSGFASFNSFKKFEKGNCARLYLGNEINDLLPDLERREKFLKYHEFYSNTNQLKIDIEITSVPFCYPYLAKSIEDADKIAKCLQAKGLLIYRYWNQLPTSYSEYQFYSRLVPIPL